MMVDTPDQEASRLLSEYGGLIRAISKSAIRSSAVVSDQDLWQVGAVAVLTAVKSYDPSCGSNIKSYVGSAIRRAIYNEAATFLGVFTVDRRVTGLAARVNKLSMSGKTDEQIANDLNKSGSRNFDVEHVKDLRIVYANRNMAVATQEDCDVEDFEVKSIESILSDIPNDSRERFVLENRILGTMSVDDVAASCSISRDYVYRLERLLTQRIHIKIRDEV
jgi:RNA polymerase sigma factor (sigma-70 family)